MQKEENLNLIKKLAAHRVDTGLLRSSKKLGSVRVSKRELMSQALNELKAGIDSPANRDIVYQPASSEASDESDTTKSISKKAQTESAPLHDSGSTPERPKKVGSGLRSSQRDEYRNPIMRKRRRQSDDSEQSWQGLTSASEDIPNKPVVRASAFKAWATSQVNEALGFVPSSTLGHGSDQATSAAHQATFVPRKTEADPLPPEVGLLSSTQRIAHGIAVPRDQGIEESRSLLPVIGEEQRIMEAVHNNRCVVVSGETGSGKTTQIPQFLYEAGYGGSQSGMIGITQPRRVAAMSMARRVAAELGPEHGARVAHQVRFDSSVHQNTAIKFMTDGILLREIASDFILRKYSAIVIDEAHERSSNTDILIGMMSRIIDLRETMSHEDSAIQPLKLIIMSATLRVRDFLDNKSLFRSGPPPLVEIEGRQHPVAVHFARETHSEYVEQMFRRVRKGHRVLPPGGMLVFLPSQDDITRLGGLLGQLHDALDEDETSSESESLSSTDDAKRESLHISQGRDGETRDPETKNRETREGKTMDGETRRAARNNSQMKNGETENRMVRILPLYAALPATEQLRVFEAVPPETRLIVLATNVAETSLTIPGIRYVFDCGRVKEKVYDKTTGVQNFQVVWISKASAQQRAGRAGRTGPGHCYRLYSSAVFERDFPAHSLPEIARMPVEDIVLQLKSMDLHNVVNFPFPTPPDRQALARAEKLLVHLSALSTDARITPLGRHLALYPVSPRFAKMLTLGNQQNCMRFVILLVAAMAQNLLVRHTTGTPNPHNHPSQNDPSTGKLSTHTLKYLSSTSDALRTFSVLHACLLSDDPEAYCRSMSMSYKSVQEAHKLFEQLLAHVLRHDPLHLSTATPETARPSPTQTAALQQIAATGFLDQTAIRAADLPSPPFLGPTSNRAIDVPYMPLGSRDPVYIHPSSLLARRPVERLPKYIVYSHLQRGSTKTRMHAITDLDDRVLSRLAKGTPLLRYGKPMGKIVQTGRSRTCVVSVSLAVGEDEWPLPAQEVQQTRDARGEWLT